MFKVPERYRLRRGVMASDETYGNNGAFEFSIGHNRCVAIASDRAMPNGKGGAWEHVSVRVLGDAGPPDWQTMCAVRELFWSQEDWVVQFHPPASEYVNFHPDVLHLWRPVGKKIPTPPSAMVGPVTGKRP